MSFWSLVLEFGPILAWYRFPAAEEFVVVFFRLMMHQMFSIGERSGLQAGQFSTQTLLLRSHAVVIAAVCGLHCPAKIHKAFPEIDVIWRGGICCSKTFIYLSAFTVPSNHASCPHRMHLCTPIPSEMLAFELNADNTQEGLPPL